MLTHGCDSRLFPAQTPPYNLFLLGFHLLGLELSARPCLVADADLSQGGDLLLLDRCEMDDQLAKMACAASPRLPVLVLAHRHRPTPSEERKCNKYTHGDCAADMDKQAGTWCAQLQIIPVRTGVRQRTSSTGVSPKLTPAIPQGEKV